MKLNVLIIGQGLAGSILAATLEKYNIAYNIIDDGNQNTSSHISAGMMNPITGIRMVKTWMFDELFSHAIPFYKSTEKRLGLKILHDVDIFRPFSGPEYLNDWSVKYDIDGYKSYIKRYYNKETKRYDISNPFGGLLIQQSGWVDTSFLLNKLRKEFIEKKRYWKCRVTSGNIKKDSNRLWQLYNLPADYEVLMSKRFSLMILATGLAVQDWHGFNMLPFTPLKGELLTIKPTVMPSVILSSGFFCIPISKELCRLGTTYERDFDDDKPTQRGKEAIIDKARRHLLFDFDVVAHQAGIRPTTKDRMPCIGWSNDDSNYGVFSGFGSKGCSLIPYFADNWIKNDVQFGIGDKKIDKNVCISRF